MGQIIFLLLMAFAIICGMYGLSQGVQTVQNGIARLVCLGRNTGKPPQETRCPQSTFDASALSPVQRCLGELQTLQQLYQAGVLSQGELAQFKQEILADLSAARQGQK